MFKTGDRVKYVQDRYDSAKNYKIGVEYVVGTTNVPDSTYHTRSIIVDGNNKGWQVDPQCFKLVTQEKSMLDSVKEYLKQHKDVIITIGVVLLVDHLVFGGAFREKVKSLVDGLINKAEKQLKE